MLLTVTKLTFGRVCIAEGKVLSGGRVGTSDIFEKLTYVEETSLEYVVILEKAVLI